MSATTTARRPRIFPALLAAVLLAVMLLVGLPGSPAQAAPSLSATSSEGNGKASASGATTMTIKGSGYQSIKNGFGGIYVVFGYVANSSGWKPSQGGKGGKDFFYVADSQTKDNKGYQKFVAYPGSSTADSANGGTIASNGTFSTTMVIPGPTFTAATADGGTKQVDCREVTCGIITFGAHGVTNAKNEAFTPVSFGAAPAAQSDQSSSGNASNGSSTSGTNQGSTNAGQNSNTTTTTTTTTETTQDETGEAAEEQPATEGEATEESTSGAPPVAVTNGEATLGLEQQTVIAGRSLGFTGLGFAAGEQVVATLSFGLTAAGPITAGSFGEIAGVVQIPADTTAGTHTIKLSGAGSGNTVEAEFSVVANAAALTPVDTSSQDRVRWALIAVIVAGAILLILVISSLIAAIMRRNKKNTSGKAAAAKNASSAGKRTATKRRRKVRRKTEPKEKLEASARVDHDSTQTTALDRLEESLERENA